MNFAQRFQPVSGWIMKSAITSPFIKLCSSFTLKRPLPLLPKQTIKQWYSKHQQPKAANNGRVYLFNDEFLDLSDSHIGIQAILLLEKLGYEVVIPTHTYSGRTYLSKGLVKKAAVLADKNILLLKDLISEETPLIGIEPSAILSFRDEYPQIASPELKDAARNLSRNALMFDEFIVREVAKGKIRPDQFTEDPAEIKLHGHCHQKAIATTDASKKMLQLPVNYKVTEIPSGCCGMAGSFGYEKEHYELSMKIGELVLFPEVRKAVDEVLIVAPGTSCREQILHGTGRKAYHPVEILFRAME